MKRTTIAFIAALLLPPGILQAQAQRLGWLSGCWQMSQGRRVVTEHWSAPRGGMLLGSGHTTRGDSTIEFEQVRIFERDGKLVYHAQPSRQSPAEFVSYVQQDTLVGFENPAHDFPQRVIYRRRGSDSLIARIEGPRNGREVGIDFPYARISCSG